MPAPFVELRNVSKRFGADGRPVLDRVSFRVEPGETVVLLGSSGAGKTTALRTINRLVEPDEGEVEVEGREIRAWDPIRLRRRTGYVIQEVGLFPHLSVEENVELIPKLEGWSPSRRKERVRALLALVGLPPERFASLRPKELSGGERQRVGVARALAVDPPLLLMDEPFGALDSVNRRRMQDEFLEMKRNLGKTIVIVTHDVPEAVKLGDRIGVMHGGRLLQFGPPAEILERPANDFVSELVGVVEASSGARRSPPPRAEPSAQSGAKNKASTEK
ncbi:MAG TPA: ATP-binding cassette domain-containing protein [Vicinamibacteria bacterium]|nr:ATP-binding cassette domain-containing protein [Vicinamibacteria bacterium]